MSIRIQRWNATAGFVKQFTDGLPSEEKNVKPGDKASFNFIVAKLADVDVKDFYL